jgi:hypothetical protein
MGLLIYTRVFFFQLYVLLFKDLAATIVLIDWGHFLYYHSFSPLPTLAEVVNLLTTFVVAWFLHYRWPVARSHEANHFTQLCLFCCSKVESLYYRHAATWLCF